MSHRFLLHFLVNSLFAVTLSACSDSGSPATNKADGVGGTAGSGGNAEGGTSNRGGEHSSNTGGTNTHQSTTPCENTLEDLCAAASDNLVRCQDYTEAERNANYEKCTTRGANIPFSCQYITAFAECEATIDCSESSDSCVFKGMLAAKPSGWDISIIEQCIEETVTDAVVCEAALGEPTRNCLTKYEECGSSSGSPFHDDACYTLGALTKEAANSALDCLSLDCSSAGTCLKNVGAFDY